MNRAGASTARRPCGPWGVSLRELNPRQREWLIFYGSKPAPHAWEWLPRDVPPLARTHLMATRHTMMPRCGPVAHCVIRRGDLFGLEPFMSAGRLTDTGRQALRFLTRDKDAAKDRTLNTFGTAAAFLLFAVLWAALVLNAKP